jgi:hypothetical protein
MNLREDARVMVFWNNMRRRSLSVHPAELTHDLLKRGKINEFESSTKLQSMSHLLCGLQSGGMVIIVAAVDVLDLSVRMSLPGRGHLLESGEWCVK